MNKTPPLPRLNSLLRKQQQLKTDIAQDLDILIGSVVKSPAMSGYCLTDKIKGKTVTRSVRQSIVADAIRMSRRCQTIWKLLRELSQVNWLILKHQAQKG